MQFNYSITEKSFRIIAFIFGLTTIIVQFVIMQQGAAETGEIITRTIRFFSFMTILTNILVALTYILPLTFPSSKAGSFFAKANTQSAVLVYILVVCAGYHFLLAKIWNPQGLQYWVDRSLHYYVPAIYLLFHLCFVQKGTLLFSNIFKWLIYPFVYLLYALIRGLITGDYPYPFLNLDKHDASKVFATVAMLIVAYILLSLVVVLYDKTIGKSFRTAQ